MTRKTVYRLILWVLTVAWGGAIWLLSLQSGTQSSALSSGFTAQLLSLFRAYRDLPAEGQAAVLEVAQSIVREFAHVAEYTLLGVLTALLAHSYHPHRFALAALIPTALFAVADECLQEFATSGRAFQFIDLLKDWLGCLLGIGFIWLVFFAKKRTQ